MPSAPLLTARLRLTHNTLAAPRQIVFQAILRDAKAEAGLNDGLFENPKNDHASHIFVNLSGLKKAVNTLFDDTKQYEMVISEVDGAAVLPADTVPAIATPTGTAAPATPMPVKSPAQTPDDRVPIITPPADTSPPAPVPPPPR